MVEQITLTEKIKNILLDYDIPMSTRELSEHLQARSDTNNTLQSTISSVSSAIFRELNRPSSSIVRLSKGKIGLVEWLAREEYKEFKNVKRIKKPIDEIIAVLPKTKLLNLIKKPGVTFNGIPDEYILKEYESIIRYEAEERFDIIQFISVFIIHDKNNIITHKRAKRSPESRLHDEYSIMFGGHILSEDLSSLFNPFIVKNNLGFISRELNEEVILKSDYKITPIGMIYDDSREVSSQHVGLIFTVATDIYNHEIGEKGFLIDAKIESLSDIEKRKDDFENWSIQLIESFSYILAVENKSKAHD